MDAAGEEAAVIGDRWGVTEAEIARRYPCDELVASPVLQAWRGVTVAAPPAAVWPWLRQIRLAPYSYDWIDNLGRRSPRELQDLTDPEPGDTFTRSAGRSMGRVLSVQPGEQLTGRILGATMSYVLEPVSDGTQDASTRLLLKVVTASGRWYAPLLSVGDLVMSRRQLLNLGGLAEQSFAGTARPA